MFRRASLTFRMGVPPGAGHIVFVCPPKRSCTVNWSMGSETGGEGQRKRFKDNLNTKNGEQQASGIPGWRYAIHTADTSAAHCKQQRKKHSEILRSVQLSRLSANWLAFRESGIGLLSHQRIHKLNTTKKTSSIYSIWRDPAVARVDCWESGLNSLEMGYDDICSVFTAV